MLQWGFKCASRVLKEVEWMFEGSFQVVSTMFQGSFKGVSRKIEGSFETHLGIIQGRLKYVKEVQMVFKGNFKNILRKIHGFKASVKYFSRKFRKKFQGCFKNLSRKFCFAILCMNLIAATRAEGGLVRTFKSIWENPI